MTNVITLNVRDDCRLYERNPRTVRNEKFDEIKESIRKRGLDQMIAVTQRPGEKQHIPAKGGNTRLEILQELVAEGEVRFLYMDFVKVPYRRAAPVTRRAVFGRDGHRCQYCGSAAESIDHIVPRSRGGDHTWENVVACCRSCNIRKGDRLPGEGGFSLARTPGPPRRYAWIYASAGFQMDPDWKPYLEVA